MSIKTLIVDDEPDGAQVLQILLKKHENIIDLLAIANNLLDAVALIHEHKPQLVFLDIEMPDYKGYEIINFFDKIDFSIVFVTAYDEFAIKAFEMNAVDYLLKPINRSRLSESIEKVQLIEENKKSKEKYLQLMKSLDTQPEPKIVVNELNNNKVILLKNILAIEADGTYSTIHLKGEKTVMTSKNLGHFEKVLPENSSFFRTHKSWIINTDYIISYQKSKGEILMFSDLTTRLSKYKKMDFEAFLAGNNS